MKKITILLLASVTMIFVGLYQSEVTFAVEPFAHVEDFTNSELTGSYADGSFTGIDNITWTYKESRDHNADANKSGINGNAIMLRRSSDGSSIKSSIISGGISSFEVKLYKGFTGKGNRQVELFINGISKGTSTPFDNYNEHVFKLDNLNIEGDFTIEIKNITSSQVIVDDISWNSYTAGLKATINQLFGPENELSIPVDAQEYGQDIVVPVAPTVGENEFQFGVVNGIVKHDFDSNNIFPITDDLEVSLVYGSDTNHAVLFVDSNGKLLSNTWVSNNGTVSAPSTTNLSKPGYVVSENQWLSNEGDTSLENIDSSRVYTLQYELNESPVNISVNGNTTEYAYNQIVTIESSNEAFTAWVENGRVISTSKTYTFTALTDRVITESTTETSETRITLSDDLKLREDYQTFVGQIDLREGEVLVEYGLVLSENGLLRDVPLTLEDGVKAKSDILLPRTNEFMMSISDEYQIVRAYVVARDAEDNIETYYSDYQYSDVILVYFDTDGGNEIPTIIVKTNAKVTEPVEPTRGEDIFLGWYEDEEFTMEYNFNTLLIEDITLYAKWEIIQPAFETVTFKYTGTTGNMTTGNNAAIVGLVESVFNVTTDSVGSNNNMIGLNADGSVRLYADRSTGNGNTLTVATLGEQKISAITIVFGVGSNTVEGETSGLLKLGSQEITLGLADLSSTTKTYTDLDITEFSLKNTTTGSKSGQIWIVSIEITYSPN